ncbi:MAG TPA: methyltransferase domain-containing protein [Opitutaceae bacterium]|nr:methyltransferase domain-containing protein [Opitutaceae bacterium]
MSSDLAAYYAHRAREYEQVYAKPERQDELRALRLRVAGLLAGRRVLELACGTGYWTAVVAASAERVRAVDVNEEVLAVARAKVWPAGRVAFVRGDAYAPPPAPDCDAGLAAFWWSHVPRVRLGAFLDRWHRTLGHGARIVLLDNVYAEGSSTPIARTDAAGDTWQRRRLADGREYDVLKNFPTESELGAVLRDRGQDVVAEFGRYYWLATYRLY